MKWIKIIAVVGMLLAVFMAKLSFSRKGQVWEERARSVQAGFVNIEDTSKRTVTLPESDLFSLIMGFSFDYVQLNSVEGFLLLFSGLAFVLFAAVFLLSRKASNHSVQPTAARSAVSGG